MSNKIILGTRGSKLSTAYANRVINLLLGTKPLINKEIILKDNTKIKFINIMERVYLKII